MSAQSIHEIPDLTVIFAKIRKAKDASGLTNQELADKSGIPYNSVCTITAGTAKQATLANVAAICAVLGLSLDEIAGLRSADTNGYIRKLEIENACMKKDVEHFKHLRTLYHPLIFGLISVCAILLCALICYIVFDIQLKNIGLFKSSGSTVLAAVLAIVIIVALTLIAFSIKTVVHDARIIKRPRD